MARYAATLAYVRTLEEGIPQSWEHVHYTRPEVDQAEAVITWHGELIRSYAVQAASEKVTRLANETINMLREKREKVVKEDGSIAARNIIARLGKGRWEHVHYTRPEVDQAEAVITWHGELIRSYAVQAASEKVTRLANETINMLREKREKVVKEDGSIAARNIIARLGKGELRTDAALREQVLDVLVVHRHLIPTARRGHYMMMVPHD